MVNKALFLGGRLTSHKLNLCQAFKGHWGVLCKATVVNITLKTQRSDLTDLHLLRLESSLKN